MKKQISNVGLFAELTAVGGGGGGGGGSGGRAVKDLIGSIGGGGSLSDIAISGESFSQRRESQFGNGSGGGDGTGIGGGGRARRGERTEAGGIGTSGLSTASAGTFKSEGSVDMSTVEKVEGDAANEASRDMRSLQSVLSRYQPRLKKVYEDFLKRSPDLKGKMVVKFTIEPDGSVSNIVVVSSELNNPELEAALLKHIQRIRFAPANGKLSIEWPLVFSQS